MSPRFRFVLACLLAASGLGTSAQTLDMGGRRCAVPNPTLFEVVETVRIVEAAKKRQPGGASLLAAAGEVTIPVAFHVITRGTEGDVPLAWIEAQIDTLNAGFGGAGYRFVLALVERVENEDWYTGLLINSNEEKAMKARLGLDPAVYLNVFTAALGQDYLGWASVPDAFAEVDTRGGVVLLDQSLPGGDAEPYHLGHTAVHEVGHWMGLFHTFQGGCTEPNDGVVDTPQERSGASGCPEARDSCPTDPGADPVTNYMDYSDDACMTGFTSGQNERVRAMFRRFRPTLSAGDLVLADVARTAFTNAPVGQTTAEPLAVTNLRDVPVQVMSASSTDGAFAVTGLPATVPPGEVATLAVAFTPSDAGVQSGVVTLELDDGTSIAVSVVGTSGRLPALAVTTPSVEGETVEEGVETAVLALANEGTAPLTFAVETVDLPGWVVAVSPTAGTVREGEAVSVDVQLSAVGLGAGTYSTVLIVSTNDPLAIQVEVPLTLIVRARPVSRVGTAPSAELIENDAASGGVVLANDGAGVLSFQIDPDALPEGVASVTPASGTVAPGQEVSLSIAFASAGLAVGEYQAEIEVQTNDPFAPVVTVPVTFSVLERPGRLTVLPIYPNPGRGEVTIPLEVPADADATAEVFDAQGRLVATIFDGSLEDGYPTLAWDASGAPAGLYVVRVRTRTDAAIGTVVIAR